MTGPPSLQQAPSLVSQPVPPPAPGAVSGRTRLPGWEDGCQLMTIGTQEALKDHDLKLLPAAFPSSKPVKTLWFSSPGAQDCPREWFSQDDSQTSSPLLVFCGFLLRALWELLIIQCQQNLSSFPPTPSDRYI